MRSLLFVFLIACGGGTKTPPSTVTNQPTTTPVASQPMMAAGNNDVQPNCAQVNAACVIDTFGYFTKRMCACKDKGCANKINDDMTKWGQEVSTRADKNAKPTEAEQKQVMEVVTKYTDCMTKVMMDGATPPPPEDPCGGGNPCGD